MYEYVSRRKSALILQNIVWQLTENVDVNEILLNGKNV